MSSVEVWECVPSPSSGASGNEFTVRLGTSHSITFYLNIECTTWEANCHLQAGTTEGARIQ